MQIHRLLFVVLMAMTPVVATAQGAGAVIDAVWEHIGGRERFAEARYLQFTWAVERDGEVIRSRVHTWDRETGDYVLRATDPETGDELAMYFNVHTRSGTCLRDGDVVDEEENQKMCDYAYGGFINDTYWFIAPAKLEDPGVHVSVAEVLGGADGDTTVLNVTFDEGIGLTPGDRYWLYVLENGRVVKWRYVLESGHEGVWAWTEETDCGMGLVFATRKQSIDGNSAIVMPEVRFSKTLDRSVFQPAPQR